MGNVNPNPHGEVDIHQLQSIGVERTINSQTIRVLQVDNLDKILLATGTAAASTQDSQNDYAKGAIYIDTDVTTGNSGFYENLGTSSSSSFALTNLPAALSIITGLLANDAVTEAKVADSAGVGVLGVRKFALAVYDFAVDGGTEGTITLGSTATIPDNAIVTAINYDVITTLTSSGDAATIKLNLPTDGDLSTAIAISDGTDPWDAGAHLAAVITPIAQKTTGARALQIITAGGQDITAGKIIFAVEYYVTL